MEQAAAKLVDMHARARQHRVIGAADRADDATVVALRKDDRDLYPAPRGRDDRVEQGRVGRKIRGGDHRLLARRREHRDEDVGHRRMGRQRAGADRDRREAAGARRRRGGCEYGAHVLAGLGHPRRREDQLGLARDGAFVADQDVDPRREVALGEKGGIGAVLAATPRDPAIDDDDLAVVAQVGAMPGKHAKPERDGQRRVDVRTGVAHRSPLSRADQRARADRIGDDPACDAAARGAAYGVDDLGAVAIAEPDVEGQMDRPRRGIDIGDDRGDRRIRARCDLRRIARCHRPPARRFARPEGAFHRGRQHRRRRQRRVGQQRRVRRAGALLERGGDPRLAEQQIEHCPDPRQRDQQQQPRRARIGVAPLEQDRAHDHREMQRAERQPERRLEIDHASPAFATRRHRRGGRLSLAVSRGAVSGDLAPSSKGVRRSAHGKVGRGRKPLHQIDQTMNLARSPCIGERPDTEPPRRRRCDAQHRDGLVPLIAQDLRTQRVDRRGVPSVVCAPCRSVATSAPAIERRNH